VSDLISISVDWTGIAQMIKFTVGVFSPCCLVSHDCQLALFGLPVALSADAEVSN